MCGTRESPAAANALGGGASVFQTDAVLSGGSIKGSEFARAVESRVERMDACWSHIGRRDPAIGHNADGLAEPVS